MDLFSIDSLTGEVRFLQDPKFDHHSPAINNFDFTVRVRDPFGNFSDKTVNFLSRIPPSASGRMEVIGLMLQR